MDHIQDIRRLRANRPRGRALRQIVGVLILVFAAGQALVAVHAGAHPTSRLKTDCSVCLLGVHAANLPDIPPCVSRPRPAAPVLAGTSYAPYVQPTRRTRLSRAPPHA